MHQPELLSAREAARRLNIRLPTLYAYVSRGLVRSIQGERRGRRLYFREDYFNVKTNVPIPPEVFDPAKWVEAQPKGTGG